MSALLRQPSRRANFETANALVETWVNGNDDMCNTLIETLIDEEDDATFDMAFQLCEKTLGPERAGHFRVTVKLRAEIDYYQMPGRDNADDFLIADLFAIGVVPIPSLPGDRVVTALHSSLPTSGMFSPGSAFHFFSGWLDPDEVDSLSPCQTRALLTSLCTDRPLAAELKIRPAPSRSGVSTLLGAVVRPNDDNDDENILYSDFGPPVDAYDNWRRVLTELNPVACELVVPCSTTSLKVEIRNHLRALAQSSAASSGGRH